MPGPIYVTTLLDRADVLDWVSTAREGGNSKRKDSALETHALLKFSLADIPAGASLVSATLHYYVERSTPDPTDLIQLYFIEDDSWSSQDSPSPDLYNWPNGGNLITEYPPGSPPGWRTADVLLWLNSEFVNGRKTFSLKWEVLGSGDGSERCASPGAYRSELAPYIEVVYQSVPATNPDLSITRGDITFSPMTPGPNTYVQITAKVRNNGGSTATNVLVRFFDGFPKTDLSNQIDGNQYISSIPGGGGTGIASVQWTAPDAPGYPSLHNIYVQVDPNRNIPFIHEGNKTAFRPFWLFLDYANYFEDFEVPADGRTEHWQRDWEMPLLPSGENPRMAGSDLSRLRNDRLGQPTTSLHLGMDGFSDDGNVFIKRRIPINPGSGPTINLSFWLTNTSSQNVVAMFIGDYEPEVEKDFFLNGVPSVSKWKEYTYQQAIPGTSEASEIWVALGVSITWESQFEYFVDDITITVT